MIHIYWIITLLKNFHLLFVFFYNAHNFINDQKFEVALRTFSNCPYFTLHLWKDMYASPGFPGVNDR